MESVFFLQGEFMRDIKLFNLKEFLCESYVIELLLNLCLFNLSDGIYTVRCIFFGVTGKEYPLELGLAFYLINVLDCYF